MHYEFADCGLDQDTRSLRRGGEDVHVEPKVMDLLLFLIRHRDRMIPRQILLRELWLDAVVSEASLARLVKEARRAVGDDGRRQEVVMTVHGRGYRFVASVTLRNGAAEGEAERSLELARLSLEASLDHGARDLRERVQEFVDACVRAVRSVRVA